MTALPYWQTESGSLGTFVQGVSITPIVLNASNTAGIQLISKNLPTGLKLDTVTKTISGIPLDPGITTTYEFVLRAFNFTGENNKKIVQDRTFTITIESEISPILLTPSGTLQLGLNDESYVLNKSTVNFQFQSSTTSVPNGQTIKYYIEEGQGELPPGLKLSESGLLYGTIDDDLELDYRTVQGSYDKDYYDINPYDYGSKIETAQTRTTITSGKVTKVDIISGGDGYLLDPDVIVGGSVNQVVMVNGGGNYTNPPKIVFSNSPVSGGITAEGYAVLNNGSVVSIVLTNPGTGYTVPPTIYFQDENTGSGANAICDLRQGAGAEFKARVSNGRVAEVSIINPGSGYLVAPLLSFGLPTAGSRIISKIYKFNLTVSTGNKTDTKEYTINVKSENSLRVDTTFILSDSVDFDSSRTYIQSPIWITPAVLPLVKGNNNFIYDLEVFDPTPNTGKLYFSLMDDNFDSTKSELGPADTEKNRVIYNITSVFLTNPVEIKVDTPKIFKDGDRVRISNVGGTIELNNNAYYLKKIDDVTYDLYSDANLITSIDGIFFGAYTSGGDIHFEEYYLILDKDGGEINGFIPYQPSVSKTYQFTVKVARIIEDTEVSNTFKTFELTIEGNIQGNITYNTPSLVGTLKPNELSLLKIDATSTIPSASVNYQLIPGYGAQSKVNYVELDIGEQQGKIFVEGYGLNPVIILEKGQSYKINVKLTNFSVSFRNSDGSYYNTGIKHSTGATGNSAQEKSSGYYIFLPPFDGTSSIVLYYTNVKKDGLFLALKKYNQLYRRWDRITIESYFSTYDAYTNNQRDIREGKDVFAILLEYNKVKFKIIKYNRQTLSWDDQNIPIVKPTDTINNRYWLDIDESNFGLLDFRYVGIKGVWTNVNPSISAILKDDSMGSERDYYIYDNNGVFTAYRKNNNIWREIRIVPNPRGAFNPNVFFKSHYETAPVTNLQYDIWFKYTSLYDGYDQSITVKLKSLDNLPTDLSIGLSGDVIGKISPATGNTYKGYYSSNILYIVHDVVEFDGTLYICTTQYRSAGDWYAELSNWSQFSYSKRITTSIDVNGYGIGKFSIAGPRGDDGTSIDKLLRFRIRAKDTQNVSFVDKDFNIDYQAITNKTLTNIYLQPFLNKENRDRYFNFITDPTIFPQTSLYRSEDPNFGLQRIPKMLLLGGIESTIAERYASAVKRNYYDRPLYFGDLKVAIAQKDGVTEYEVIYVEINDPYDVNGISISDKITLDFDYDPLTVDYTKLRMDETDVVISETGLNTVYPSSITLMQNALENVTLAKTESVIIPPVYDDYGRIPEKQLSGPNIGQYIDIDPLTGSDDWGTVTERVAIIDDFLSTIQALVKDDTYRPLWMNTSQDATGNPIGFVKAVPICYVKPGQSSQVLKLINKSKFDFKALNFTIDRIIIQTPEGETGDKYIKFINREII